MHRIRLVAATDMSVMIFGENGTGKSGIKGIYLVWNMVDGREKTEPVSYTHLDVYKRQGIYRAFSRVEYRFG